MLYEQKKTNSEDLYTVTSSVSLTMWSLLAPLKLQNTEEIMTHAQNLRQTRVKLRMIPVNVPFLSAYRSNTAPRMLIQPQLE